MSFQSLAFFGFLAAALAVCLTAGRRSPRAGAAMLAAASAVFYLLGPGGWTVVLGGIACLLGGHLRDSMRYPPVARVRRRPPDNGSCLRLSHRHTGGIQVYGVPHRRRGGGGLGSAGAELFYLPAAVVAEGGLYRGICPRAGGFPSALRAVFPHRYLRPHSAARNLFPPAAGKGIPPSDWSDAAAGIYAICCGTIKKVLLADAFGTVVNNGWVHLGRAQRSGRPGW